MDCTYFHFALADVFSLNGFENEAALGIKDGNGGSFSGAGQYGDHHHKKPKSSELSRSGENGVRSSASHEDVPSVSGDDSAHGGRILDDCGLLPNNCLPCMASAVGVNEKKRALSSSPTHSMKLPSLKLSFKKKSGEAHPSSALCKHFFISHMVRLSSKPIWNAICNYFFLTMEPFLILLCMMTLKLCHKFSWSLS
jgi:hypothetical protein